MQTVAPDFDLNVEKVLDDWGAEHAIREIIANALDEQALTGSRPVEIRKNDSTSWTIRDYGRGLRYVHLTQNENAEKLDRESEVIGRFGVGLKDALAVLDRRGIGVVLRSGHGDIMLAHRPKAEFSDVETLHARVLPPSDPKLLGTEVVLTNVSEATIAAAKRFFLRFAEEEVLDTTKVGQILSRRSGEAACIYVKGLIVAHEPDFAFSYNITALTKQMRKALNRERTNVGRSAYSERVKAMLLASESPSVAEVLAHDLNNLASGLSRDEVRSWSEVGVRACQILNASRNVVFVTADELVSEKEMVDRALIEGREVITVPATIASKLGSTVDLQGKPLQSLQQFAHDWSASVEYKFVPEADLTSVERAVFARWREIADLDGGIPSAVKEVLISETMRPSTTEGMNPAGLWERSSGRIIIHRQQLRTLERFAGTLLHELVHARWNQSDVSREFELSLTNTIGRIANIVLRPNV